MAFSCLVNESPKIHFENYFGQQRARDGHNDNPSIQQCIHNAAALRVQKSLALNPVRGNSSHKRQLFQDSFKLTIHHSQSGSVPKSEYYYYV